VRSGSDGGYSVFGLSPCLAKGVLCFENSIPTRIERSRCWNLAAVTEIDCSIEIDSKIVSSYLLLLWKTKMRKDTNLQTKVY